MKKHIISCLLLCVVLFCCACENPIIAARKPLTQAGTRWKSVDGRIVITVDEGYGYGSGKLILEDAIVDDLYVTQDFDNGFEICTPSAHKKTMITEEDILEHWECSYKSKKKFVATVVRTTYFQEGEEITFFRVDE